MIFERVRIGPGKAVARAIVGGKLGFCLPGGPSSNEMAFLQLALPGLLVLAGLPPKPFERRVVRLATTVEGTPDWTQFFQATLEEDSDTLTARPLRGRSRLRAQADAEAIITLPQGRAHMEAGTETRVQLLHSSAPFGPTQRSIAAIMEGTAE